jgi:hypothetical protein
MKKIFSVAMILSFGFVARAQGPVEREVTLEIEEVEGALSYDLEITKIASSETKQFSITRPLWVGRLAIGKYQMRNRSIDGRGVAGNWSKAELFEVGLDKPKMIEPETKISVNSDQEERANVHWRWEPVDGALGYSIEVNSSDNSFHVAQSVEGTSFEQNLPGALRYSWRVIAQGPERLSNASEGELTVIGRPLDKPVIETPINSRAPQIRWTGSKDAESYKVQFEHFNTKTGDWDLMAEAQPSTGPLIMNPAFPDGNYRVKVVALAALHLPSPEASATFKMFRAPMVLAEAPWAIHVGLGVDFYRYSASNSDVVASSPSNFHSTGESLQLGMSRLRHHEHWGMLIDGEISEIRDGNDEQLSAATAQLSLLRRDSVGLRGELLSSLGVRYKQLPISVADASGMSNANVSALGPELGMFYAYKISPFWGVGGGMRFGEMLMTLKTPNDRSLDPTLCSEVDLSVSEKWSHSFATSIEYRHRDDQLLYESLNGTSTNLVSIRADSFNLTVEYDF